MTSIETHTFSNGLKLVLERLPGCRSGGIAIGFPAGGRTEEPKVSGISHYLEHMIFKGTKTIRYFDRTFEEVGASTNAVTDVDTTVYIARCPKRSTIRTLKLWLQLLAEASLDPEEFERERGVILSEYFITEDNPDALVEKYATLSLFKGHPLASTVIGTEETIKAISHRDMVNYFRYWYHPSYAVIWVSADLRMDKLINCVDQQEDWMKQGPPPTLSYRKFEPKGPFNIELHRQTRLVQIGLALSSPTQSAQERASLQVLSSMLSAGQSSMLRRRLVLEGELTDDLRVVVSGYQEAGMLLTSFAIEPMKEPEVLEVLEKTVRDLRENVMEFMEEFEVARSHAAGSFLTRIDAQMSWRALQGAWETLRRGHCPWDEIVSSIESLSYQQFADSLKEITKPERIALILAGTGKEGASRTVRW
jgi:predicted Zn-dependent peptidase